MARVIFYHAPEAYSIVAIQAVVVLLIIWMFLALDLIILPRKNLYYSYLLCLEVIGTYFYLINEQEILRYFRCLIKVELLRAFGAID